MAATTSGTKTVTVNVSPVHTAATLTTLFATPVELLTIGQLTSIVHFLDDKAGGKDPRTVIGTLFS